MIIVILWEVSDTVLTGYGWYFVWKKRTLDLIQIRRDFVQETIKQISPTNQYLKASFKK